jgi:putative transposase
VHAADFQDADGAGALLKRIKHLYGWLEAVCHRLRPAPTQVGSRETFGWLGRWRRLSKDYEELPEVSEPMVKLAMIRLVVHRLAHPSRKRLSTP